MPRLGAPGKKGQQHNDNTLRIVNLPPTVNNIGWDVSIYLDRWDLIEAKLRDQNHSAGG